MFFFPIFNQYIHRRSLYSCSVLKGLPTFPVRLSWLTSMRIFAENKQLAFRTWTSLIFKSHDHFASRITLSLTSFCMRSSVGSRAFSVAGPQVWNCLPPEVTSAQSLATFRTHFTEPFPDNRLIWHLLYTLSTVDLAVFLILRPL